MCVVCVVLDGQSEEEEENGAKAWSGLNKL